MAIIKWRARRTLMEVPMAYDPKPIDTTGIALDAEVLQLTELLAKHAHDIWALWE